MCSSASACVALGNYQDTKGGFQGEILVGSGTSWKAIKAPLPSGAPREPNSTNLQAVTCPSASSCVIVGFYEATSGITNALVIAGHGTTWTPAKLPQPDGGVTYPQSVACVSISKCATIADNILGPDSEVGVLFTGRGTNWKRVRVPLPKGASTKAVANLTSLSCTLRAKCVAVGSYGSAPYRGLVVTGAGSSWHAAQLPLPAGVRARNFSLQSVGCAAPRGCAATGSYTASSKSAQPLIDLTTGINWTAISATLPGNASKRSGISTSSAECVSAKLCIAAGFYSTTTGRNVPLILSGPL